LGFSIDKSPPPLERKIRYFLYDLCVDWGFCIPPEDADRIASMKCIAADKFAIEVMKAEGFTEIEGSEWAKKIAERFIEHFDTDELTEDL
jgi:hypothetical protein